MITQQALPPEGKRTFKGQWRRQVLPGLGVISLVILARILGLFQALEWKTLDTFLRLRPPEPKDDRILIVGINEQDIQNTGTYPIPDHKLATLIDTIARQEPRAIGIDIIRDLPVEPGHADLKATLTRLPKVFGIEFIAEEWVAPPPVLPPERVGFADFPLDSDGFVRRAMLGAFPSKDHPDSGRFHFSFALKLAEAYLEQAGVALENGHKDPNNMRFGSAELFQVYPNTGSYIRTGVGGIQILINPRSGPGPFDKVSMTDILNARETELEALVHDRVVLVGITSRSAKDLVNSAAVNADNPGLFYGVEMQAHVVSQILSAVLDGRAMLRSWPDPFEYFWIFAWSSVGILLVRHLPRPKQYMSAIGVIGIGVIGISLLLLQSGWWIPLIPTLVGLTINGWVLPGFYLYDQTLRSRIEERQRVIEQTYDAIHNGPLQTLALLLRQKEGLDPHTAEKLTEMNQNLRDVYERLREESLPAEHQLQLVGQGVLDLRHPLHEVLYEVYTETLKRDFPGFDSIKFQIVKFEPLETDGLTSDCKRSLCRFLEEALCNVGKHAVTAKRLTVICMAKETENLICVEDSGKSEGPPVSLRDGRGTQQAKALANYLGGRFHRTARATGTYCELQWPLRRPAQNWWSDSPVADRKLKQDSR